MAARRNVRGMGLLRRSVWAYENGRRSGFFFRLLAVTDQCGPNHDKNNTSPTRGGNTLVQEPDSSKGREDETQARQRPQKTDIGFGHKNEQTSEEKRFKKNTEQDLGIRDSSLHNLNHPGRSDHSSSIDLGYSLLEQHDTSAFKDQPNEENQ